MALRSESNGIDLMPLADQLIIREAKPEDLESIVTFSTAMAFETENKQLDAVRLREGTLSLLNTPSYGFFIVAELREERQSRLIGQLMITYEWSDWRNAVFWWVQSVYVAQPWRRQGVFRRMHAVIAARAKSDARVCGIRLYVEQDNRTAQNVYQRVGLSSSAYTVYEQDFVLGRSND